MSELYHKIIVSGKVLDLPTVENRRARFTVISEGIERFTSTKANKNEMLFRVECREEITTLLFEAIEKKKFRKGIVVLITGQLAPGQDRALAETLEF